MALVEKKRTAPLGIRLAQEAQGAITEWERKRQAVVKRKTKGVGHPRPKRERTQIHQADLRERGKFIGQKLTPILGESNFSEILGNHINSYFSRKDFTQQLEEVKKSLEKLSDQQISLAIEFYHLRQSFAKNPNEADLAREKIEAFNLKNLDQIPEESFLAGLFRTISNLYPDPETIK